MHWKEFKDFTLKLYSLALIKTGFLLDFQIPPSRRQANLVRYLVFSFNKYLTGKE